MWNEKPVARITVFVVRVFSATCWSLFGPCWSDQIRARGSEGIPTRPTIKLRRSICS